LGTPLIFFEYLDITGFSA